MFGDDLEFRFVLRRAIRSKSINNEFLSGLHQSSISIPGSGGDGEEDRTTEIAEHYRRLKKHDRHFDS